MGADGSEFTLGEMRVSRSAENSPALQSAKKPTPQPPRTVRWWEPSFMLSGLLSLGWEQPDLSLTNRAKPTPAAPTKHPHQR